MIQEQNYVVIQGFMRTTLNLKGSELITYAIIYGFSQTSDQKYTGNLSYLSDWTGLTKSNVIKCLKSLVEKKLITKEEQFINNVKFPSYSINQETLDAKIAMGVLKQQQGIAETAMGYSQNSYGGIAKTAPNNTIGKSIGKSIGNNNPPVFTEVNTSPFGKEFNNGEEKEKGCAEKEKEWDEVLQPWLEYKKDRKQAYKGERALKALRTKLKNLSGGNVEIARLIIEQSMANNWAGLFKLHDQGVMGTAPRKMNANDEAFDEIYREIFKTGFVWQEDTTAEIQKLADAIASKAPDENYSISPGEMPMLIKFFLQKAWAIEDQWLREHFTPKNINNQFNTIYAYIKSGRKSSNGRKNNPYGVSEEFLAELGQGLSDTAQRFQAAFGGDDNR